MKVLVIGGTGTVGTAVVDSLRAGGHEARVMTRSADKASRLPAGVEPVIADLAIPDTLPAAFAGVDAAFLNVALTQAETAQGLAGVAAARAARVGRLVYMSVVMPPGSDRIPHFASKIPVEQAVRESGLAWTILRPNNFFQNDGALRVPIMDYGVYPQPLGDRGVNRVDVRDIGEAAVNAISRGVGGIVPLNGPRGLTGGDTARVYSELLGRPIRYAGNDVDAWASQVAPLLPPWLLRDLRIMYEFFIENGAHASGTDFAAQEELLGRAPRPFEAFAAELTRAWTNA
jgi:uncharacterized protein YbjT (DUF2867 family)